MKIKINNISILMFMLAIMFTACLDSTSSTDGGAALTYMVTYNDNESDSGTAPVESTNYEVSDTVTVLENTGNLTKDGYFLEGWCMEVACTGTTYEAEQDFTMGSQDVILYAKWAENPTYTVTYNNNGYDSGDVPVDSIYYEESDIVTVLGNAGNLAKDGYTFEGWCVNYTGIGTIYSQDETFAMESEDVTLYAKWTVQLAGILDITFNTTGYNIHDSAAGGNSYDKAMDIALNKNGKIIVTGYSNNGSNHDMAIWRYNSDGTLDTTFNSVGYTIHASAAGGNGMDIGMSLVIDENEKIVVAGTSTNSSNNFDIAIWRYNSDGTLDTSFNSVGYAIHNSAAGGNSNDMGNAITIDENGKILVTGSSYNETDSDMVIFRYNNDGTLDTTFNTVGYTLHHNASGGNGHDIGNAIAINEDGKILVTGFSHIGTDSSMVLWQYNTNGTLDTTFNTMGYTVHSNAAGGDSTDAGTAITIDENGKILIGGYSSNGSNFDMVIWRYNINGTLDTSFDSDGYTVHNNAAGGDNSDMCNGITIDGNGKILVTGYSNNGSNLDMVIWRYNINGTLDTSFDSNGYTIHNNAAGGNSNDCGNAIAIDGNGKILVAGYSSNGTNDDMALWRYE